MIVAEYGSVEEDVFCESERAGESTEEREGSRGGGQVGFGVVSRLEVELGCNTKSIR
jgi:hypothetical protein